MVIHFTNDPYVDRTQPRQYDDFEFDFPSVTLSSDGKTFHYQPAGGPSIPVAVKHAGLFDAQVSLLPSSQLQIDKLHGKLALTLVVGDTPGASRD